MKYHLIREWDTKVFNGCVNSYLQKGWRLHGPTSYISVGTGYNVYHYQAMVKDEEGDPKAAAYEPQFPPGT